MTNTPAGIDPGTVITRSADGKARWTLGALLVIEEAARDGRTERLAESAETVDNLGGTIYGQDGGLLAVADPSGIQYGATWFPNSGWNLYS